MILFFHFICLLARYIFLNISKSISKRKVHSDDDDSIGSRSSDLQNTRGLAKQPVYEDGVLKFFPPVYVQRYETIALILQSPALKGKIRKVVDFGCAELGFFIYLKHIDGINEVLAVDIDSELLETYSFKAAPLNSDYLISRYTNKPLDVYILAGSIADYDDCLIGTDAVIGIELIEHLSEEAFNKMPYNVFHQIKPKLAIFTTPNADFNSLFPNFTGLRHSDHKFEWTRKEFFDWTQEIITQYPEYSVKFYGIGAGPEGTENLGCCSQMAVFQRSEEAEPFASAREELIGISNYKLINHFNYPVYVDTRTTEEKIVHEVQYHASHINSLPNYYNYEENECEIPLSLLKEYVVDLCSDDEEFRNILIKNGMKLKMKNGSWYLKYNESEFDSSDNSFEENDWLNEEVVSHAIENEVFGDNWDYEEEALELEDTINFQSARSLEESKSEAAERKGFGFRDDLKEVDETKSAPVCCDKLCEEPLKNLVVACQNKNREVQRMSLTKSKIPRKMDAEDVGEKISVRCKQNFSNVCKPYRKISKSCSLDSCLENINGKLFECESYYLNLIPGSSVPFRNISSLSHKKSKHMMNDSGSSLLSSSLDKALDSGYPFSFSPPDADLTPEQVDELFTENEMMSRSTSASSEVEMIVNHRINHDLFLDDMVVENGDLANNNRDGEGNNVEGLIGERLVNEMAAGRDPNDNMMFFPEVEEFPPWLLNLGDLALRPVFIPLNDFYDDEGVGDDSSSEFNHSIDPEDLDFYFESLEMS